MKTWIALLRGVNMVGKRKMRMKDLVALRGDVFFFYAPEGFHKTKIGPWLKRSFYDVDGTGRTWSTLTKVMAIAQAMG